MVLFLLLSLTDAPWRWLEKSKNETTPERFELSRAKHNRLAIYLLNHSDTASALISSVISSTTLDISDIYLKRRLAAYIKAFVEACGRNKQEKDRAIIGSIP